MAPGALQPSRPAVHRAALLILLLGLAQPSLAEISVELERAGESGLSVHPTWHALLHIVRGKSEVPDSRFFLTKNGRTSPSDELEAMLRALLAPESEGGEAVHCRFPARARWLTHQLGLASEDLPQTPCPALDDWRESLAPRGITLIFPEAFMNNPASMFGHTLLRLDVADPDAPENLLAYAIDFTAKTGGDAGPVFMAKGTFGLYPGYFGLNPYYEKLAVYADWQNRDIWEYPLDLTSEEVEFVLLHLWELDEIAIPYYFFRQNCSYQLIRLLAVARPELGFRHGFPIAIIPVDTVRDALDEIGLLGEPRYRPSPATELRVALAALTQEERRLSLELARGALEPEDERVVGLAPKERGAVLGAAYEALRYTFLQDEKGEEQARDRSYRLLVARSRAAAGGPPSVPVPAVRPDEGHGTALVALAGGVQGDEGYVELRIRPGFHGRLDPSAGFPGDSTVGVLDTRLRWFPGSNRLWLEELVLVELQSNTPRDAFFRPLSWGMETGLRTRLFPDDGDLDRRHVWRSGGSLGLTFAPGDGPFTVYGLADARLEFGSGWEHGWAAGPGAELGLEASTPADRWKGRLFARGTRFVVGDRETHLAAGLGGRLTLGTRAAALVELTFQRFDDESWLDASLSLRWTF